MIIYKIFYNQLLWSILLIDHILGLLFFQTFSLMFNSCELVLVLATYY